MSNLLQLRLNARQIFDEALHAVNSEAAVSHAVRIDGSRLSVCYRSFELSAASRLYSIAIGKAAPAMAVALENVLGELLFEGVLTAPAVTADGRKPNERWQRFAGGHPLPNEASRAAAEAAFALLDRANQARALVIFLISGGGSAMLEAPVSPDISLEDLRSANQTLVASGASISEINSVRRAFSAVKGGKLAARAPHCDQITLIVSDVPQGEEGDVASGPTLRPPADAPKARDVVERYQLRSLLPESILRAIDSDDGKPRSDNSTSVRKHFVLLDNDTALEAAATTARARGLSVEIARDISDEPIELGVEKLLTRLGELKSSKGEDVCLISGGEFDCPVRGDGLGGRNLETALRLAIAADQSEQIGEFVALCAGTDGIDGNSPAAGAIVDSTTIERARRIGLDANDFLQRSDSYSFFVALGDAITTGPTGTNVRDFRILLSTRGSTESGSDRIAGSIHLSG